MKWIHKSVRSNRVAEVLNELEREYNIDNVYIYSEDAQNVAIVARVSSYGMNIFALDVMPAQAEAEDG